MRFIMFKKGTKIYSIFTGACPQCQEERMYPYKTYNLSNFGKMNKRCGNCNLKYSREPSFFTGSTYVSYGITVALIISVYLGFFILQDEPNVNRIITIIITIAVLIAPLNFRLSRNIWINLFVKYKEEFSLPKQAKKI
ncbi:MAG: DUF983 domain-containing protein [Cyclobacteriaceae bacterium]